MDTIQIPEPLPVIVTRPRQLIEAVAAHPCMSRATTAGRPVRGDGHSPGKVSPPSAKRQEQAALLIWTASRPKPVMTWTRTSARGHRGGTTTTQILIGSRPAGCCAG